MFPHFPLCEPHQMLNFQGSRKTVAKSPVATTVIIWLQNIGYGDISGDKGGPATSSHSQFSFYENGVHFGFIFVGFKSKIDSITFAHISETHQAHLYFNLVYWCIGLTYIMFLLLFVFLNIHRDRTKKD